MIPGLPRSPQSLLWDRVCVILRANSTLVGALKTIQLMDGKSNDFAPWTANDLPAIRLSPAGGNAHASAEHQHDAPLIIQVELGTQTSYAGDMFDLWQSVVSTFFPGDNSVLNALANATPQLCYWMGIVQAAWTEQKLADNTKALYAKGALVFKQHINT